MGLEAQSTHRFVQWTPSLHLSQRFQLPCGDVHLGKKLTTRRTTAILQRMRSPLLVIKQAHVIRVIRSVASPFLEAWLMLKATHMSDTPVLLELTYWALLRSPGVTQRLWLTHMVKDVD